MDNMVKKKKSERPALYRHRFISDCRYTESVVSKALAPNDNAVTDADVYRGRVGAVHHGQYYKDVSESLNPLHRRGVDFTDVGNILAGMDSQEEMTAQKIAKHRESFTSDNSSQSNDQN